jgi:peptidylprolyl isomerase
LTLTALTTSWAKDLDPENTLYLDLKDGRVTIEMFPGFAPNHVTRVKELTRTGYYDGLDFHRVIDGFMAQTGSPDGLGVGGSELPDLQDEFNIKPHWRGMTSMANTGEPNSANAQFFIMLNDNLALNGRYTVWGRVVSGMQHVDAIKIGDGDQDGKVEGEPDRVVRMQVAADADADAASAETAEQ